MNFTQSIQVLLIYKLVYLTKLNDQNNFKLTFENSTQICKIQSAHWFRLQELKSRFYLRCVEFEKVIKPIELIKTKKKFRSQNQNYLERVEMLEVYCGLIMFLKDKKFEKSKLKDFRFYKSLNSLPKFDKDKRGMNISIIIAQLIYLILCKDDLGLEARFDAEKNICNVT